MLVKSVAKSSPRPGIEPGPSTWQAEILTTRLSRNWCWSVVSQPVRISLFWESRRAKSLLRAGFEPATYGYLAIAQLQSTALPTELSKVLCWMDRNAESNPIDWGSAGKIVAASSGNRTRAARVAGEHSTTEPTMLCALTCNMQRR